MKSIYRIMMLPLLALPLLFASCETDDDSNPKLDLSHLSEGFVLNMPAYAENNTYDVANSEGIWLSCSQPNYGGNVPYVVNYFVQLSLDPTFAEGNADANFKELATSYTKAKMQVSGSVFNTAVVDLYQQANPDEAEVPATLAVYVRLRACIDGGLDEKLGETFSNVIKLPSVHANYVAPDVEFPANLFIVGSSIQDAWTSWKEVPQVFGQAGCYYSAAYIPDGGSFKWGTFEMDWRGFDRITIDDQANAGVSSNDDGNIVLAKGGWYTLYFEGAITPDKKSINYTLHIYPMQAYVIGGATGAWNDSDPDWALTAPADRDGEWVSPAFTASGELRAYIKIPGFDWYRTEFTIYGGKCFWRTFDIPNNWEESGGADYSVKCAPGQRLYVNFDKNTAEVK